MRAVCGRRRLRHPIRYCFTSNVSVNREVMESLGVELWALDRDERFHVAN